MLENKFCNHIYDLSKLPITMLIAGGSGFAQVYMEIPIISIDFLNRREKKCALLLGI